MISVIVPVFQVEPFLEQCLDSIIGQTYHDIEILLIDDGSPDRCGEICDRYAAADPRIWVFHTENKGLSAARNLGIEHAHGTWLSFVDSDDWIEPNMLERLMEAAEESSADIAVCGRVMEYPNKKEIISPPPGVLNRDKAVRALSLLEIRNPAWDKLWKRECFESIRFPEGRVYEDIATTFRVFLLVDKVTCIAEALYHYRVRDDSISHDGRLDHLVDFFRASKEEYEEITGTAPFAEDAAIREALLSRCAKTVFKIWARYSDSPKNLRTQYRGELTECARFIRANAPAFATVSFPIRQRILLFLCRYSSGWAFGMTQLLLGLRQHIVNWLPGGFSKDLHSPEAWEKL